jgi:hypothetical protein
MMNLLPGHRSGLPTPGALDSEQLRIDAALAHIREHGNLDDHPGDRNELRAIMVTAVRRGLVAWDRRRERYILTSAGKSQIAGLEAASARVAAGATAPSTPAQADLTGSESLALVPGDQTDHRPIAAVPVLRRGDGRRTVVFAAVAALAVGTGIGGLMASSRLLPVAEKSKVTTASAPSSISGVASGASSPAQAGAAGSQATAATTPSAVSGNTVVAAVPAATQGAPTSAGASRSMAEVKSAEAGESKPEQLQGEASPVPPGQADATTAPPAGPSRSIFERHHHHYSRHERRAPEEPARERTASTDAGDEAAHTGTGDQAVAAAEPTEPAETGQTGASTRHYRRHWRSHRHRDDSRYAYQQDGAWGSQPGALSYNGRDGVEGRSSRSRRDDPYGSRRFGQEREAMEYHGRGNHSGPDPVFGWLFR